MKNSAKQNVSLIIITIYILFTPCCFRTGTGGVGRGGIQSMLSAKDSRSYFKKSVRRKNGVSSFGSFCSTSSDFPYLCPWCILHLILVGFKMHTRSVSLVWLELRFAQCVALCLKRGEKKLAVTSTDLKITG